MYSLVPANQCSIGRLFHPAREQNSTARQNGPLGAADRQLCALTSCLLLVKSADLSAGRSLPLYPLTPDNLSALVSTSQRCPAEDIKASSVPSRCHPTIARALRRCAATPQRSRPPARTPPTIEGPR